MAVATAAPLASEAVAAETSDEKLKCALQGIRPHQGVLSRQPLSDEVREARRADQENGTSGAPRISSPPLLVDQTGGFDRRTFLRRAGFTAAGLAAVGGLPLGNVRKADAAAAGPLTAGATVRKSICTHCAVGCTVTAEVLNGVWIGQEPSWDSPINRGSHCAKGASVRELVHSDRRLRYPMKLVNGQWTRTSWETAINEIGDKLMQIREKSGRGFGLLARFGQDDQRRFLSGSASSARFGAPTTPTTRRVSAIRPRLPAWPIPGATAR